MSEVIKDFVVYISATFDGPVKFTKAHLKTQLSDKSISESTELMD